MIEYLDEVLGNHFRRPPLNLMSFHHMYQLSVFKKRNGGRRGRVREGKLPHLGYRIFFHAGKNGAEMVWPVGRVFQRHDHAGTRRASGTTANRVYHNQLGSGLTVNSLFGLFGTP